MSENMTEETNSGVPKSRSNPIDRVVTDLAQRWFRTNPDRVQQRATASLTSLVKAHGGSGTAVIQNMGQRGYRIIAIAADGTFGDAVVPTADLAKQIALDAGLTVGEWERETIGRIAPHRTDRVRMAGTGR